VSDDELARALGVSIERRVGRVSPRPDLDDLLTRLDRGTSRRRVWYVVAALSLAIVAAFGGFLIGSTSRGSDAASVVTAGDGVPDRPATSSAVEPADVLTARADIVKAFQDAYTGGTPDDVRVAAIQRGTELSGLRRDITALAHASGYTAEQLDGTTVSVLDVTFIDETHAAVRFTLSVPGHGDVLVDRIGFAVVDGSRWKVALRTACDLLSLNGVQRPCPPK
jgi:hypothetical protein